MTEKTKPINPYEILGVDSDAPDEEIKLIVRRLVRELHPDLNQDPAAAERMAEINAAYELICTPEKRLEYDAIGADVLKSTRVKAEEKLEELFDAVVNTSDNPVQEAASVLHLARLEKAEKLGDLKERCKKLRKRRARVRRRPGGTSENLVHKVIDRQIRALQKNIVRLKRELEVYAETGRILIAEYEEIDLDPDDPSLREPEDVVGLLPQ